MSKVQTKSASQSLATNSLTISLVIGTDTEAWDGDFLLDQVLLAAGSAISQVVTVRHIGAEGSDYNVVLNTSTLSSETSYSFRPDGRCPLKRGDTIRLTCANSGTPAITVYGKIQISKDA